MSPNSNSGTARRPRASGIFRLLCDPYVALSCPHVPQHDVLGDPSGDLMRPYGDLNSHCVARVRANGAHAARQVGIIGAPWITLAAEFGCRAGRGGILEQPKHLQDLRRSRYDTVTWLALLLPAR